MTANAKTLHLLDSYALLAFFNRERGFETVRQLLSDSFFMMRTHLVSMC